MNKFLKTLFWVVGLVFISCSEEQKDISFLNLSSSSVTLGANGTEQTISLSSSSDWMIEEVPEWLHIEPASGESGEYEIALSASENTAEVERKARLLVKTKNGDAQFLTVVQGAFGQLSMEQNKYVVIGGETSIVIPYFSNFEPEVIIPEEASSWLTLVQSKALTEHRLVLRVTENTDTLRSATVLLVDRVNEAQDTVIIKHYPQPQIELASSSFFMTYNSTEDTISLSSNIPLDARLSGNDSTWFQIIDNELIDGQLQVSIICNKNEGKQLKKTTLVLENKDCALTYNVEISQMYLAEDGDAVCLQEATYTPPVIAGGWEYKKPTFIFTGDGFTREDIETGVYDRYMREAYEGIFTTEPYKSLSNRFNAWILYAVSNDEGITTYEEYSKGQMRDTRFGVYFYDTSRGMRLSGEDGFNDVINYAKSRIENYGGYYAPETGVVVVVAKTDVYGGTTLLDRTGKAVALCPLATSERNAFPRIVAHEAGGHGFGKLADEYYPSGGNITNAEKNGLLNWQSSDIYLNVSLERDADKVPWSWLIGKEGYEKTGVFAGGYYYLGGVWRSSDMSIMKDALVDKEFNAYSRFLIFERLYGIYDSIFPNMPGVKPVKDAFLEFDKEIIK